MFIFAAINEEKHETEEAGTNDAGVWEILSGHVKTNIRLSDSGWDYESWSG